MISKQGLEKRASPEKSRADVRSARPQAPTANESHAWAKVTEALANIPRSFLPCTGLDPAVSSQEGEDGWEDRRRPLRSWSQSPSRASRPTQQGALLARCWPAKLSKHVRLLAELDGGREEETKASPPRTGRGPLHPAWWPSCLRPPSPPHSETRAEGWGLLS